MRLGVSISIVPLMVMMLSQTTIMNAAVIRDDTTKNQRGILDDFAASVSALVGGSPPNLSQAIPILPQPQKMYDNIIITPPPFPSSFDPHWSPGTTNHGGIVHQAVATLSGISSALVSAIGANNYGPLHLFNLNIGAPILPSNITSIQVDPNPITTLGPEFGSSTTASSLFQGPIDPIGSIVNSILNTAGGCNEVRRFLQQC